MHRFYLPPELCRDASLELSEQEAHHAVRVLRLNVGDAATLLDGIGHTYTCEVAETTKRTVRLEVRDKTFSPRLPCQITLIQAMPKPKAMDYIVQKATELGVARIVPLLTERVVSQLDEGAARDKAIKLMPVALEAIKQCGSPWLPRIEPPQPLQNYLKHQERFDLAVVASLHSETRHAQEIIEEYRAMMAPHQPTTAAVWIGPEGDFTPSEMERIIGTGVRPITLGTLVLRSDTAAIYCLSVLNHELQRTR